MNKQYRNTEYKIEGAVVTESIYLVIIIPEVYKFSRIFQKYTSYLKIQIVREAK